MENTKVIDVHLWEDLIGKLAINDSGTGFFKYSPEFISKGIEPSPIWMPVNRTMVYSFPKLNTETYKGLPGLIADSLPDAYGNRLLDIHFERQGISNSANVELLKLCYISTKGMGALEYAPPLQSASNGKELSIGDLISTVDKLVRSKQSLDQGYLNNLQDIISIGSSLGGAAPKAVIDIDFKTNTIRPGNISNPSNYESWIIKFDNIKQGSQLQSNETTGFGKVEYTYHEMALKSGIHMNECRLYHDQDRSHFMTKRFDREEEGKKLHMQALHGIAHMDSYGHHDYKTYFKVFNRLKLPFNQHEEMFRRIVFNGISGNTDTHTKNTSFLMNQDGKWSLSPAYDLICSVSMRNNVEKHKTLINGKTDSFTKSDFLAVAQEASISPSTANKIIHQVQNALSLWKELSNKNDVNHDHLKHVAKIIDKNLKLSSET